MHQVWWPADYLVLSGALGKQTLYHSNVLLGNSNYSMPVMHTAIPYTSNTADQAVSTVHLQLGATKHLN